MSRKIGFVKKISTFLIAVLMCGLFTSISVEAKEKVKYYFTSNSFYSLNHI